MNIYERIAFKRRRSINDAYNRFIVERDDKAGEKRNLKSYSPIKPTDLSLADFLKLHPEFKQELFYD